jgi:hypothetical protein
MVKPTPEDIRTAVILVEDGGWLNPDQEPFYWSCELHAPDPLSRPFPFDGCGRTAAQAMAMAWIHAWCPDALIDGEILDDMPYEVPDDWRFELTPPWQADLSDFARTPPSAPEPDPSKKSKPKF